MNISEMTSDGRNVKVFLVFFFSLVFFRGFDEKVFFGKVN